MEQQKTNLSEEEILKLPTISCECGSCVFEAGVVFKKLSSLISPTGKEEKIPLNIMFCKKCGKIPADLYEPETYALFPDELKQKKNKGIL